MAPEEYKEPFPAELDLGRESCGFKSLQHENWVCWTDRIRTVDCRCLRYCSIEKAQSCSVSDSLLVSEKVKVLLQSLRRNTPPP